MPSLVSAGGIITLVYYDSRKDDTAGALVCPPGPPCSSNQFVEVRQPVGDLFPFPPTPVQLSVVFNAFLADIGVKRRHTLDVRVAQAMPGPAPIFSSTQVSQYLFGSPSTNPAGALQIVGTAKTINQLRFNPPNLPLFAGGTKAFIGDYIDVAASPAMVTQSAGTRTFWRFNVGPSDSTAFHASWTDNRDVVPPPKGDYAAYTPAGPMSPQPSFYLPGSTRPGCVPRQEGTRDQNIYTSRITQGLFAGSPGNSKQLGTIQRGFVVFVQNARPLPTVYRLTIPATSQPPGGQASFQQFSLATQIDVVVAARSSVSRTVFVASANPRARVTVNIAEIAAVAGSPVPNGLQSSVVLNPDLSNPDLSNPDLSNPGLPDVGTSEVLNAGLSSVLNPDLSNPDLSNPDLSNPGSVQSGFVEPGPLKPGLIEPRFDQSRCSQSGPVQSGLV